MSNVDLDQGGRPQQLQRTWRGPSLGYIEADQPTNIIYTLAGGGQILVPGVKPPLHIPLWLTVVGWMLYSDIQGSLVIDIWKVSQTTWLAGTVPTVANTICGSDKPRLTNQVGARSTALTGWTTVINQNDIIMPNIDSNSGVFRASLVLQCIKMLGTGE